MKSADEIRNLVNKVDAIGQVVHEHYRRQGKEATFEEPTMAFWAGGIVALKWALDEGDPTEDIEAYLRNIEDLYNRIKKENQP